MGKWIMAKDDVPSDGQQVIAINTDKELIICTFKYNIFHALNYSDVSYACPLDIGDIICWQPLPKSPFKNKWNYFK